MLFINKKFINKYFGVLLSLAFIFFCFLISVFSYFIIPDDSQYSNQMHLPIHSMPPGFKATILEIPNSKNSKQSYFSIKFFGNKNSNKEILVKKYNIKETGINYENYNDEKIFLNYNIFSNSLSKKEINTEYIKERKIIIGTDTLARDVFG